VSKPILMTLSICDPG